MSKKALILSGSPRKGGNSDLLCDAFMKGALEAGNEVKKIFVHDQKIAPCNACGYCMAHGGVCLLQDDMADILEQAGREQELSIRIQREDIFNAMHRI